MSALAFGWSQSQWWFEMTAVHSARVVAVQKYRLKTLTVRDDLLVLVRQGAKVLYTPDSELVAKQGQCVLMAKGTQWDVVNDPMGHACCETLVLPISAHVVQQFNALHTVTHATVVTQARVFNFDDILLDAVNRVLAPSDETAEISQAVLMHRVMEVLLLLSLKGIRLASDTELSWVDRVRRLVAQKPQADWSVDVLCDMFHMSESTLRRRLKENGVTLAGLVREVRLEQALGMLQTSTLQVGEVAQRCGWDSHSRFSAAFLNRWGVSPSTVRSAAD